jgi:hypothetical protein
LVAGITIFDSSDLGTNLFKVSRHKLLKLGVTAENKNRFFVMLRHEASLNCREEKFLFYRTIWP